MEKSARRVVSWEDGSAMVMVMVVIKKTKTGKDWHGQGKKPAHFCLRNGERKRERTKLEK